MPWKIRHRATDDRDGLTNCTLSCVKTYMKDRALVTHSHHTERRRQHDRTMRKGKRQPPTHTWRQRDGKMSGCTPVGPTPGQGPRPTPPQPLVMELWLGLGHFPREAGATGIEMANVWSTAWRQPSKIVQGTELAAVQRKADGKKNECMCWSMINGASKRAGQHASDQKMNPNE